MKNDELVILRGGYDCYTGCYVYRDGNYYTTTETEMCGSDKAEAEANIANAFAYLYPESDWSADCPYC